MIDIESSGDQDRSLLERVRGELGFLRGDYLLLIIGALFIDASLEMAYTYYPLFVRAIGGSAAAVGLLSSIGTMIQALIMIPGGYMADRYGRRWIITVGTFGTAVAYLFFIFAPSWEALIFGVVIRSACNIYAPAYNAVIMDIIPPERRGTGYSILNLITRASTTPTPMLAGFLYSTYGLVNGTRYGFTVVLASYVLAGLLRSRIKETLTDADKPDLGEIRESLAGLGMLKEGFGAWRQIPRNAVNLMVLQLLFYVAFMMYSGVSKFFIVEDLNIDPIHFSTLFSVVGISNIAFTLPVGRVIDKYGKKGPMVASLAIYFAALLMIYNGDLARLYIALPMCGLGYITFNTASSAFWADLISQEYRGRIIGTKSFMEIVAASMGLVSGGLIYDYASHSLPIQVAIASCGVLALAFLFLIEEPKSQ
jgi:MFS family permease